jgi:hypothetical protein
VGCCVACAAGARENMRRSDVVSLPRVAVVGGALRAVKDGASGWKFRKTPRGVLIYVAHGERAGAWGGWYLNYDHKGKDPVVGLVPVPGPGCYWTWSEGAWRKNSPSGFGYTFECTARPVNGPLRGRSLTLDSGKLVLSPRTPAELTFEGSVDDLSDGK